MGTVVDKLKSAGQETSLSPPATRREKTAPALSVSVLKAMLRCIGSVSATRLRAFIHSLNPNHASSVTPKKAYCSSASEKEVLFTTPSSVPLVYRFVLFYSLRPALSIVSEPHNPTFACSNASMCVSKASSVQVSIHRFLLL